MSIFRLSSHLKLIGTCLRGSCKAIAAHSLVLLLRIVLEHLIRLSYVAKHEFKKSNLRHSRNRWLKDVNRKKNLKGRTIERVRLFHEYLLVAKKTLTDCFNRFKTVRRFFFISRSFNDFFDRFSRIPLFDSKSHKEVNGRHRFVVVSSQIGQSHPLVWLIEIE